MVWEMAQIEFRPGTNQSFEEAVRQARPLFERAPGCHGVQLRRSAEYSQRYRLVVEWETVEHHTVDFQILDELPMTLSGKIQKFKLRDQLLVT